MVTTTVPASRSLKGTPTEQLKSSMVSSVAVRGSGGNGVMTTDDAHQHLAAQRRVISRPSSPAPPAPSSSNGAGALATPAAAGDQAALAVPASQGVQPEQPGPSLRPRHSAPATTSSSSGSVAAAALQQSRELQTDAEVSPPATAAAGSAAAVNSNGAAASSTITATLLPPPALALVSSALLASGGGPPGLPSAASNGAGAAAAGGSAGITPEAAALASAVAASKLGLTDQLRTALANFAGLVNLRDNEGRTCLHYAAGYGNEECVDLLLSKSADTSAQDCNGDVPLHFAAIHGHPMCAYNIGKAGCAACLIKNARGQTPVDVAVACERGEVLNAMLLACAGDTSEVAVRAMRKLLKDGAVPDTWAPNGSSALMLAASVDATPALQVLLEAGASIELQDALGRSALMFAAGNCAHSALVTLLDAGACMSLRDRRGRSVLDYAPEQSKVRDTLQARLRALEAVAQQRQHDLLASLMEGSETSNSNGNGMARGATKGASKGQEPTKGTPAAGPGRASNSKKGKGGKKAGAAAAPTVSQPLEAPCRSVAGAAAGNASTPLAAATAPAALLVVPAVCGPHAAVAACGEAGTAVGSPPVLPSRAACVALHTVSLLEGEAAVGALCHMGGVGESLAPQPPHAADGPCICSHAFECDSDIGSCMGGVACEEADPSGWQIVEHKSHSKRSSNLGGGHGVSSVTATHSQLHSRCHSNISLASATSALGFGITSAASPKTAALALPGASSARAPRFAGVVAAADLPGSGVADAPRGRMAAGSGSNSSCGYSSSQTVRAASPACSVRHSTASVRSASSGERSRVPAWGVHTSGLLAAGTTHSHAAHAGDSMARQGSGHSLSSLGSCDSHAFSHISTSSSYNSRNSGPASVSVVSHASQLATIPSSTKLASLEGSPAAATATATAAGPSHGSSSPSGHATTTAPSPTAAPAAAAAPALPQASITLPAGTPGGSPASPAAPNAWAARKPVIVPPTPSTPPGSVSARSTRAAAATTAAAAGSPAPAAAAAVSAHAAGSQGAQQQAAAGASRSWATIATGPSAAAPTQQRSVTASIGSSTAANSAAPQHSSSSAAAARAMPAPQQPQHGTEAAVGGAKPAAHEAATNRSDSSARPAHAAAPGPTTACTAACGQADSQGTAACSQGERKRRAGASAVGKACKDGALQCSSELPGASTDAGPAAADAGAGAAAAGGTVAAAQQQHQQQALEEVAPGSSGCENPAKATAQCMHGAGACPVAPAAAAAQQVDGSTVALQLEQLQAERKALAKRVAELEQLLREAQASSSIEQEPQGPDAAQPAAPAAAPAAAAGGELAAVKAAAGGAERAAPNAAAGSSNGNGQQQAVAVGADGQQGATAPAASASSGGVAAGASGDARSTEEQVAQAVYTERMRIVMHLLSVGMTPSALVTLLSPLGSTTAAPGSPSASATTPGTTAAPGAAAATNPSTAYTNTRVPGDGSNGLGGIAPCPSVKAPTPHTATAVPPADPTTSCVAAAATAGGSNGEASAAEASCAAAGDGAQAVKKAVGKAVVEPQVGTPVAGLLEERRDTALAPAASPAAQPAAAASTSAQEAPAAPAAGSVVAPSKEPAAVGATDAGTGGAGMAAAAAESSACKQALASSSVAATTMAVKPEAAPAQVQAQPQPKTAAEAAAAARAAAAAAAQRQQQAGGNDSAGGTARPAPRTAAEAAAAHAQRRRQEQQQAAAAVSQMSEMDVVQCISQLCRPVAPRAAVPAVSQWDMFRNQSVSADIASAAPLLDLRALAQVAPAYISLDLPLAAASASQQGPQQLPLPLALATECDCLERAPTLAMMGCGLDSIAAAAVDAGSTGVGSSISLRLQAPAGEELGSTLPDCGDISMALAMSDEEEDELPDLATALAKERGQASSAQANGAPPSNAAPLVPPTSSSLRFAGASLPPRPLNGAPRRSFDRPAPPSLYGAAAGFGPDPPPLPTARSTSSVGSAFAFASHAGFGAVSAPVSIPATPGSAAGDATASPHAAASPMWGATPGSAAAAGAGSARPCSLASSFEAVHSIWQAPRGSSSVLHSPWGDATKQQQQSNAQLQPSSPWDHAGAASMPDSIGIWKPETTAVGGRLRGPSLDGAEPSNSPPKEGGLVAANWGVPIGKASWGAGQAARTTTSSPGAARAADANAAAAAAPTIHKPIGAWFASVRSSSTLPAPKAASPVPAREGAPAPLVSVLGFQSQSQSGGSGSGGSPASSAARALSVSASASGLGGAPHGGSISGGAAGTTARGALASAVQPLPLAATCSEGGVPTRRAAVSDGLGGGNALSTLDVEVDPTTMLACRSGVVSPFGTSPNVHGLSCSEQPMLGMAHVEKLLSSRGCSSPRKQPAPSLTRSPAGPQRPESPTRHIPMFQADADPLSSVRDEFAHLSSGLSGLKAGLATVSGGFGTQRDQGEGPAPLDAGNGWGWSTVRRSSWAGDGLFTSPAFPSPSSSPPVHFGVFGATASPARTTGQARSRLLGAAWGSSGVASEAGSKHSYSGGGPGSGDSAAGSAAASASRQAARQLGNGQAARAAGKAGSARASRQQQQQQASVSGCTRSDSLHLPDCL